MSKYKYFSPNWMLWYSEDHYDELMEEDALLLIELEELFIDSDYPELVEAVVLSFAKESASVTSIVSLSLFLNIFSIK